MLIRAAVLEEFGAPLVVREGVMEPDDGTGTSGPRPQPRAPASPASPAFRNGI